MTEIQVLIKLQRDILSELKVLNSGSREYIDAKTAIALLGRKNLREMKYIREHFKSVEFRMKNGCTYEYLKKSIGELKQKIDSHEVILPFGNNMYIS